ncbi:SLC13 family permease [Clostridium sp. Marseille-P2415]|uniref:SLC13 family permease n=1 Tax=Clostridium sp. Marseille-P2415 TaxID=1805471 RepID=UPI0009883ABE|nr:SLC13 family permease [Clostridium sp. Marseille-P2415]
MEMYIVLAVTVFMMVSFILHKVPFGVTTMVCCLVLAMTGIMDIQTAFSGFGNKIVVLIAPMLALSTVLTKTSLVVRISEIMNCIKGRQGMLLVFSFYLVGAIFAQFIPTTAAITILVIFLATLDNTGDITPNRLLLPLLGVMVAWKFRFPIGLGASVFATVNGMYEGIISNPEYQLTMLDPFIFSIPSIIVLTLYCLFFWKLMPKGREVDQSKLKETKKKEMLSRGQETLVYIVFVIVMLLMMLNKWTGNLLYLAPAFGVLVLIYAKILKVEEAVKDMTADMVWMIAGVLVVADALGKSGAGNAIGNLILSLLGDNPSSMSVMLLFAAATVIMTTFLSNMATQTVLIPIAASVALAGGWDPRGIVLIIGTCNYFALGFPSGSGEAAVCYAAGGYNPMKVLKFTFPFMILAIVTCAVAANFMYPIY